MVGIAQGEEYDSESLAQALRDHTLFVGFAPLDQPQVALAVIVENGEKHGATTFPVVKAAFDTYFKHARLAKAPASEKNSSDSTSGN